MNHYENVASTMDGLEISRDLVNVMQSSILGKGAFGVVFLGQIKIIPHPCRSSALISELNLCQGKVAVKMLPEIADDAAKSEFLREIETMKGIGYHGNLLNIVACVAKSMPNLLITEYCANGDLLKSMREK
ncbi:hypothetical protein PRIPAC_79525 [Pristionchus pacificus]|nr:hypothetical protein PRIPAC_79525 [Pristionchus pacificus]